MTSQYDGVQLFLRDDLLYDFTRTYLCHINMGYNCIYSNITDDVVRIQDQNPVGAGSFAKIYSVAELATAFTPCRADGLTESTNGDNPRVISNSLNNYRIRAGSPCRAAGTTLSLLHWETGVAVTSVVARATSPDFDYEHSVSVFVPPDIGADQYLDKE